MNDLAANGEVSRKTLGFYRDCPLEITDSRSNYSGQFR
jgi:hypothetical protein